MMHNNTPTNKHIPVEFRTTDKQGALIIINGKHTKNQP